MQVLEEREFVRAKTIVEIKKKSDNEVMNVPTGRKAEVILYIVQQPTKKLHNLSFIINVTALNLNGKLVINQNDKQVVQSAFFYAQEKGDPGPSRTRPASPAWQERSSASLKRRKKIFSDNRKNRNHKCEKESEEGSDSYGTSNNYSDSPTLDITEVKTKQWESYQD